MAKTLSWKHLLPARSRSHAFAGQFAGLLHPSGELSFVELVVLVDVEVAHFLLFGLAGRDRIQRRAAEESHLDVLREAMEAEEPALALDAIEGRIPLDRFAHARDGAHDEGVETAADVAFPARHGRDVGLHGGVAVGLRDLRVAACEEGGRRSCFYRFCATHASLCSSTPNAPGCRRSLLAATPSARPYRSCPFPRVAPNDQ